MILHIRIESIAQAQSIGDIEEYVYAVVYLQIHSEKCQSHTPFELISFNGDSLSLLFTAQTWRTIRILSLSTSSKCIGAIRSDFVHDLASFVVVC